MLEDPRLGTAKIAEKEDTAAANVPSASAHFQRLKPATRVVWLIIAAVVLWLASGLLGGAPVAPTAPGVGVNPISTVSVLESRSIPKVQTVKLFGVTEPRRVLNLKAEVTGRVEKVNVLEGAFVKKGDVILTITERDRKERLAEARAVLKQRETEHKAAKALSKRGYQADVELKRAAANLAAAKAQMKEAQVAYDNTRIRAPFAGVVDRIYVEDGDLVGQNDGGGNSDGATGVAVLVERDPMLVVGQVAERVVKDISVGMPAKTRLVSGEAAEGAVIYLSTVGDPETRSFRLEVEVPNTEGRYRAGMTSEIEIPVDIEKSHFAPASALSLNDVGQVGIKLLAPESTTENGLLRGTVKFRPVEISEDVSEGVWVTGLPDTAYIITLGQAFVKEGSEVLGKPQVRLKGDNGKNN